MFDFILKYWTEAFFGLLSAGMLFIYRKVKKEFKDQEALKDGMVGLLHNEIMYICKEHLQNGRITTDDLEELEYLNKPYKELGGNGTAKRMIERVYSLPIDNE